MTASEPAGRGETTRLVVALVRGLHGLDGTLRVEVLTDRPEARLVPEAKLFPEGEERGLTVATAAAVADGPGWWLTFHEIRSRAAAERLRDRYLEVEVEPGADLEPGHAYWHDVIGSEVRGTTGRSLGEVVDIYRAGESEVYVVRGDAAGEFDVPAVRGIVTEFAPERRTIVVDEEALDLGSTPVDAKPSRPRKVHRWSRHGKGAPGTSGAPTPSEAPSEGPAEDPPERAGAG